MALSDKQILTTLLKDKLSVGNTRINREFFEEALKSSFVVKPQNLWMYGDMIPAEDATEEDLAAIRNLDSENPIYTYQKDESTIVPLIKKFTDYSLTPIDNGTDNAFKLVDPSGNIINDVIPFNFYKNVYNYTLKTSDGTVIPFGVGDWIFDTYSSILTFNGELPASVDHEHCPTLTFYRYIGGHGFRNDMQGYEAALVPITGITLPANTFTFTSNMDGTTLQSSIIAQADKVEEGFVSSYGWDGADENEGIATSLEVLSPLLYSSTKDKVKGYDDSNACNIYTLLTKAYVSKASEDDYAPTIEYVSNKVSVGEHKITVSTDPDTFQLYLSFDGGDNKLYEPDTEMTLKSDNGFIVIKTASLIVASDNHEDQTYTFETALDTTKTKYGNTYAGLFYYNIKTASLEPFHTKEENTFDISFPVVTIIGKIPPSVKLNATTLDSLEDSITPDYYGPRVYNVVLAQDGTEQVKSADYIIKNSKGFYVTDIFDKIRADNSAGSIYFRAGTYKLLDPESANVELTADMFDFGSPIIFHGEDSQITEITSDIACSININAGYLTSFQNLKFGKNITLNITVNGPVTLNYIDAGIVNIVKSSDSAFSIMHSNIGTLTIGGTGTGNYVIADTSIAAMRVDNAGCIVNNSIVQELVSNESSSFMGCTLGEVSFNAAATVVGCTINNVLRKEESSLFRDCYIAAHADDIVDLTGVPNADTFPIYNKNGFLKYTTLVDPVYYDSNTNTFSVKYDKTTIFINENGQLCVEIDASQVAVNNAGDWERDSAYLAEKDNMSEKQATEVNKLLNSQQPGVSTIEDILKYIIKYKADLINGKIPLQNLPDSVAYGGLHYCGLWSVENTHRLPLFDDIKSDALLANYDQEVEELQPGWFCIIDNSTVETNNPTKVQKLSQRATSDGAGLSANDLLLKDYLAEEYTAGDWIIFEGYENDNGTYVLDEQGNKIPIWSKIDRSYQNPVYTRLPSRDPNGLHWTWEDGGTGTLEFNDDTIYEAFYEVNNELNKLKVQKPYLLGKFAFIPKKDYSMKDAYVVKANASGTTAYIDNAASFYNIDDIDTFETTTSLGSNWQSYIYFGSKADFTGVLNYENTSNKYEVTEYLGNARTEGLFTVDEAVDPFENEMVGAGYWKGTKLHLSIKDINVGTYTMYAMEDNISPLHQNIALQSTQIARFKFIHAKNTIKAALDPAYTVQLNTQDLLTNYIKYTSGIPYISTTAVDAYGKRASYKVSFKLNRALYTYLNTDHIVEYHTSFDEEDVWHTYEELINNSNSVTITTRDTSDTDYYDLTVSQLRIEIPADIIGLKQFALTVRVYNVAGEYNDIMVYQRPINDLIGSFKESNRVCSGKKSTDIEYINNPAYTEGSTLGEVGDSYLPNELLSNESNIELMCENYKTEDNVIAERYIWPTGDFYDLENTKEFDYRKLSSDGQTMNDGTIMRYVTFSTVDITESNGFTLAIDGSGLSMNDLTGINSNMSIQILVEGDNVWYDANKPMGYLEDPTVANDACMYAGSSTVNEKRISFGQRLLTGKVIVRIGITSTSGIKINSIEIKDIV